MDEKYKDCVLRKTNYYGDYCHGLRSMLCELGENCPFYASNKTHYIERKTGHIKRRDKKCLEN